MNPDTVVVALDTLMAASDTLVQATPFPIDTAAAVAVAAKVTNVILDAILPGLNAQVAAAIISAVSVGAVNVLLQLWKRAMTAAPGAIGPLWLRWRKPINTLLALGLGWLAGGTWVTGAAAAIGKVLVVDVIEAAKKKTPEGMARARHVALALMLGGALLVAPAAQAAPSLLQLAKLGARHVVPAAGPGVVMDLAEDGAGRARLFGAVQLRYVYSDHVNVGVRVSTDVRSELGSQPVELTKPRAEFSALWVF